MKEGSTKERQRKRLMFAIHKLSKGLGTREEDRQWRCRVAASLIATYIQELQLHGADATQSFLVKKAARRGKVVLPWATPSRKSRKGQLRQGRRASGPTANQPSKKEKRVLSLFQQALLNKALEGAKKRKRRNKATDYRQREFPEEPVNYAMMLPGYSKRKPAKITQEDNDYLRDLLANRNRQNNQLLDILATHGIFPDINNQDEEVQAAVSAEDYNNPSGRPSMLPYRKKIHDCLTNISKGESREHEYLHEYANERALQLERSIARLRKKERKAKSPREKKNHATARALRSVERRFMMVLAVATGQFLSNDELDGDSLFIPET
ncbi:hypothetical protein CLAFUW4_11630 [Fulvia fulva]|uniref:Uncharacterized protein n=1 Tax=Passalora fulva TaxID=5499 RepID=A0A9Q8URG1_PASFU|nr:uncharacterized protein CLAFUR5_10676 [Fulvia fulva]KAK4619780.1 hypothetical protein CLAFUR4_11635 [Fulvia fulva]KAK4621013.1 hypothetical protein CLAFUR0_11645 [Fulvia fulva]UJO19677.1 hypothetical protein CLAFUR5_10676 [Fulvia fulva]WPV17181.1 hypothetical protein CLAFUW4_11630 [Fulvia fulva]WPV32102.1 hypothetical protein CLAFUW7_11635 [Fulvia fulva]